MTTFPLEAEDLPLGEERLTQKHIRVRIDKNYVSDPVICELIVKFQLTINIKGALLAPNSREDGWFDLELTGKATQIDNALSYLNDLNLEIIPEKDIDGW
ncbi:NIL domain-containing protein [Synechococcus sp. PCC 6312]|uniref:NIL domain-containing protein n=1 Tax=Synechococcus sp. (strain ATCC 27167 / PCC 6312) TaxID=195253 RepID=UPI00029F38F9|nr:NIL domain-containing protein [Synechococcus sp. PCC 6312]AFY59720.1 NIL domain-containing protein [Synechococcus sp. PCC 6312]